MHQNTRLPTARHLQKQAPHGSPLQREESTPEVHLKSMQEFLGKMREKYAIGIVEDYGGEGTCNRTANYSCMDNFLKERAGKSTPPCTAPLPVPAYQEVSAHAETSYSSSYAPTNPCCADLRADFEGLKIMVDDLQYENRSLRKGGWRWYTSLFLPQQRLQ